MNSEYKSFFERVVGFPPHPWQADLVVADDCRNRLIRIPTGMGKTLGVLGAWVFYKIEQNSSDWPVRLVWCLPMRTLVEQTVSEAQAILEKLNVDDRVSVHALMGGVEEHRWYADPEQPAILVGTQDMLLSRALNRGYAMGRAAWPRAYGLLNTDALWVMDEVQLMGVGLATSGQIQAHWNQTFEGCNVAAKRRVTWWMSATLQPNWLRTSETEKIVEHLSGEALQVDPDDRVGPQWNARKPVSIRSVDFTESKGNAAMLLSLHKEAEAHEDYGRQTLVVVNQVKTATLLFAELEKLIVKSESPPDMHLIHSRFRPADREDWIEKFLSRKTLHPNTNRILIATQVVEAGVDISATTLISELAPWPSMVQRFGRAARYGGVARIVVLDPEFEDEKKALPYALDELAAAREALHKIEDVGIESLEDFEGVLEAVELAKLYPYNPLHVILPQELTELFDTSPDLSGADVDVSRFIREGDDHDVKVFWRSWGGDNPSKDIRPERRELCSVPIGEAKAWLGKEHVKKHAFTWDYLDGVWLKVDRDRLRASQIVIVAPEAGGYDTRLGFTGAKPKAKDAPIDEVALLALDADKDGDFSESDDAASSREVWKTIATHCREAAEVGQELAENLNLPENLKRLIDLVLRLHDWGKAHPAFATGTYRVEPLRTDLAKAPDRAWRKGRQIYRTDSHGPRPGFRHELVSCLATFELLRAADSNHLAILGEYKEMLITCGLEPDLPSFPAEPNPILDELKHLSKTEFNLVLYLIASHHGKVRASLQASPLDQDFPTEDDSFVGEGLPIRGVRESDILPATDLPEKDGRLTTMPDVTLHLDPAVMGLSARYGASWTERVQNLLQHFGPYFLAYLEAIIRAADGRASDDSRQPGSDPDPSLEGIQFSVPNVNPDSTSSNEEMYSLKELADV